MAEPKEQAVTLTPTQLKEMFVEMAKELRRPADPTEEQLAGYRQEFKTLGDDLAANGGLKASRGLPAPKKLIAFLLSVAGQTDPSQITVGQWENFFGRVETAKANPEVGFKGLTKLVNRAAGVEEK